MEKTGKLSCLLFWFGKNLWTHVLLGVWWEESQGKFCVYRQLYNTCMMIYYHNLYIHYTYFLLQSLANDIVQAGLEFLQLPLIISVWLSHVAHSTCPKQPTWDDSPAISSAIHQSYPPSWNKGNEHKELFLREPWWLPNPFISVRTLGRIHFCHYILICLTVRWAPQDHRGIHRWGQLGPAWWCWSLQLPQDLMVLQALQAIMSICIFVIFWA